MKPPILIFGVPRSGTTLLRTILNCHPHIACGPEAPWLAHQHGSVRGFYRELTEGEFNFARNFGVPPAQIRERVRQLVDGLFRDFATGQGKQRWAHKTPDDAMFVDFFTQLFPAAKFLHIVRNPLDVALSTARIPEHRKGVSAWHENNLVIEEGCAIRNTLFNATLRWRRWNDKITRGLAGTDHFQVEYEHLVSAPRETFEAIFKFLDEPFDEAVLRYQDFSSILPSWEWGSTDVKKAGEINTKSLGRWKNEIEEHEAALLSSLVAPVTADEPLHSTWAFAAPGEEESKPHRLLSQGLNDLADKLGLAPAAAETTGWAMSWWWYSGLNRVDWARASVVDFEGGLSPLPWLLALLGARVTLVAKHPDRMAHWEELRRRFNLEIDWQIASGEIAVAGGTVDVVLGTPATDPADPDPIGRNANEMVRLLKPAGLLAVAASEKTRAGFDRIVAHPAFAPVSSGSTQPSDAIVAALLVKV